MSMEGEGARTVRRQADRRRPSWVWLIAAYYLSAGAWSLAIYWQLYSGGLTLLPPSSLAYFENYTGVDYLLMMAVSALGILAAVLLLLLRRAAVYVFAFHFVYALGLALRNAFVHGVMDASRPGLVLAALLLWGAAAAVCFYAWHLLRKGLLK
jgi:hypothetical protein